jgi:glycosyltransferase involved in cell wall biosynthesis
MPKVSVIIPNYNHTDFLVQRIKSVLYQTFQDFELILLDDASNDDSVNILKSYKNHPKVSSIICNEVNSGSVFIQWVKGIELAKGHYIWIAESDDFADVNFLEKTIVKLESDSGIGMVFTDSFKVDVSSNIQGQMSKSRPILGFLEKSGAIINNQNFSKYLLEQLVIVNASSVLFKKEALSAIDFNVLRQFKNTGDVFVYLGLALNNGIYYLPQPLNYMRLHAHNTTKKNKKSGQIYRDKILLLETYLNDWNALGNAKIKQDVSNFLLGFLFLSIDYGYITPLKKLLHNMYNKRFIDTKKFFVIQAIIFFYRYFMFSGRPQFLREWLKSVLNKTISSTNEME